MYVYIVYPHKEALYLSTGTHCPLVKAEQLFDYVK